MPLALPNSFTCASRTALLESAAPIDFRPLAQHGVPDTVTHQLRAVSRFLVTVSRVRSSVCPDRSIDFTETLVKIPVRLGGQERLFPVVTYVDHEYSLIRGFLLGFHKLFAAGAHDSAQPVVTWPGLDLDLRDDGPKAGDESDLPPEHHLPLLLWTDYSVADARSHGWRTLDIEQYERTRLALLHCARHEQTVAGEKATVRALYETADQFVIPGTHSLDV
ncbi:acetoacetate decarboxylase family protein (plasmid) [Streptomyces anulatus]|uniref:hypothetical protein n=1 Tax=Streptomyces anulatus TaxID=1892 RepID=UPI002DD9AD31|nr:hypothetical protein [Streptomyces anulatus]WSC66770.1 acetoacetate decarboxylase family protein [Streptomyces anulatus]